MTTFIKRFLLLSAIAFPTLTMSGDNPGNGNGNGNGDGDDPIINIPTKPGSQKPTSVIDDNLTCEYAGGRLHFEFTQPEGSSSVNISKLDTGECITLTHNGHTFTVSIGHTPGIYQITVSTTQGSLYTGYLSIDE